MGEIADYYVEEMQKGFYSSGSYSSKPKSIPRSTPEDDFGMRTLSIDIETYSSIDLIKSGVYAYTQAPDFEILIFAYAFDDEPVQVIDLASGEELPEEVHKSLYDPDVIKTAYNANFERTCIARWMYINEALLGEIEAEPDYFILPADEWRCTAVHASTLGLPGNLDGVAKSMNLDVQKDAAGKALIRYFSVPCKPTKANGQRTRNLPEHDPEKWEKYKAYCKTDVEVERAIKEKINKFQPSEFEQKLWSLDQEINDRGVQVDPHLVQHAIACDLQYQQKLLEEASKLTGLENPNSVAQLKGWFSEQGLEVDSLSKDVIPELMEQTESNAVKRVLKLRQELSKTSVKKYQAMERALCEDERVRGLLQFYGANRTGRWAGRLVQVQNLPQNKLSDLDVARELLKAGEYEMLEILFDKVPFVLSQLIRTAFIPAEGHQFIVSDFSAIEARVIAWLAGEKWRLDVFNTHGKIYEASAAQMFNVPVESITKGDPLRQKGKVAELACIAEGQPVLTDKGLVPIEYITLNHLVWDGISFVRHEGLIYRGKKEVLDYGGLTATEDHIVWVEGKQEPIPFGQAARSGAHLLRSGNGWSPIWMGDNHLLGEAMEGRLERSKSANKMYRLWFRKVVAFLQSQKRKVKRMPSLLSTKKNPKMVESEAHSSKTTLHESKRSELFQLWGSRYTLQFPICFGSRLMDLRQSRFTITRYGTRQNKQRWKLRSWKPSVCDKTNQSSQPQEICYSKLESGRLAICKNGSDKKTFAGHDKGRNHQRSSEGSSGKAEELATNRRKVKVYDLLNAGPNNRFTVSDCLVHNCGYQGGPGALVQMGALSMGLKEEDLPSIIKAWRQANPNIVKFWYDCERAAIKAVKEKTVVKMQHGLTFICESGILFVQLPSGRKLAYARPKLKEDERFNKQALSYEGSENGKWGRLHTYGGKLVENIVQATARDCLAESLVRLDDAGYKTVMHVHDEAVLEVPNGFGSLEHVEEVMGETLRWAKGLPLGAEGFVTNYYKKD